MDIIQGYYILCLLHFLGKATAILHCYQCGVEYSQDAMWLTRGIKPKLGEKPHVSPDSFCFDHDEENRQLHSYYESVTCDTGHLCGKIVTRNAGQDTFSVQRGCVMGSTAGGQPHIVSCGPLVPNEKSRNVSAIEHICFCDTNFCNGQTKLTGSWSSLLNVFIFALCILVPP